MDSPSLLATLDSDHAEERIQVVLSRTPRGGSTVSLIQQSWSESLGWYTQKAMDLSPEQVRQLRSVLGTPTAAATTGKLHFSLDQPAVASGHPVCVPFPTASRRAHSA